MAHVLHTRKKSINSYCHNLKSRIILYADYARLPLPLEALLLQLIDLVQPVFVQTVLCNVLHVSYQVPEIRQRLSSYAQFYPAMFPEYYTVLLCLSFYDNFSFRDFMFIVYPKYSSCFD